MHTELKGGIARVAGCLYEDGGTFEGFVNRASISSVSHSLLYKYQAYHWLGVTHQYQSSLHLEAKKVMF